PERTRGGLGEHTPVGVEGEGEEHEDEQGERRHLVGGHAGAGLDAQVLACHQGRVTPHRGPPWPAWSGGPGAPPRGGSGRRPWPPRAWRGDGPVRARGTPSAR